jgi:ubiquitin-activating enzyme E1
VGAAPSSAAARLRADMYGLEIEPDAAARAALVEVPPWAPSGVHVRASDDEPQEKAPPVHKATDRAEMKRLAEALSPVRNAIGEFRLRHVEFEKDDATNGHIEFITAAANLRALNYRIQTETALEIKRIAGSIIPALATTTAMICGFVCLEIFKVHAIVPKPLEDIRIGQVNLAAAMIGLSEAAPCEKLTCTGNGIQYTLWDKWVIEGNLTVEQFGEACEKQFGMPLDSLLIGSQLVYASFYSPPAIPQYAGLTIKEVWEKYAKLKLTEGRDSIRINAVFVDAEGKDITTPPIYLKYK